MTSTGQDRSDRELLVTWREGDEEAGNMLVRRHFDVVFRFFNGKVGSETTDLLQRTFLQCVESKERLPEDVPFRAYLLGIARNVLLMHLRRLDVAKRSDQKFVGLDAYFSQGVDPTLSRKAAMREEQRTLLLALRRLPIELQIIVELHYWEDMKTKEIASVLDIPLGTVKSRLYLARKQLEQQIQSLAGTPEVAAATVRGLDDWARSLRGRIGDGGPER